MAVADGRVEPPDTTIGSSRMRLIAAGAQRVGALPAPLVLTLLIGASAALRAWAGTRVVTPWINSDEITYSQLGRNLYLTGHLDVLGRPIGFLSFVHPALVGLPLLLGNVGVAYALLKVVQAVVISLTAVPVYLWARRLVHPAWALVASALTLSLPGLAYASVIMSEVTFLPLMTLAAYAMAAAVARPSLRGQALVFGAIALCVATRLQALILLPAFVTAIVLKALFDRRLRKPLRDFAPSLGFLAGLGAVWVAYRFVGGQGGRVLGGYQGLLQASVDLHAAAQFVMYLAADVVLLAAVLPVCAAAMLIVDMALLREADDELKAYIAVVSSLAVWLVVEVGTFAARYVGHLAERNLLPLAPAMFIGFVAWLARGAHRPQPAAVLTAIALFVLLATLPVSRFSVNALPDAFMLVPLQRLQGTNPGANLDFALPYFALPMLALFVFMPRRLAWLFPLSVAAVLVYTSVSVSGAVGDASRTLAPHLFGSSKDWIDRASRGPVGYLYAGEDFNPVFENIFWNRRIRNVYAMPGTLVPGPLPQTAVQPTRDGLLRTARQATPFERFVVAGSSLMLRGTRIATAPKAKLALWHINGPPIVSAWLAGVDVASSYERGSRLVVVGAMGETVRLQFYGCRGGTLRVRLAAGAPRRLTIFRAGVAVRHVRLQLGKARTVRLATSPPADSAATTCEFTLKANAGVIYLEPLEFNRR
jgi:Dolichyl-phosphate-mannose-protein mannosyltransferase